MTINIAPLAANDEEEWRVLWKAYCAYYDAPVTEAQTALTWTRIIDPEHPIKGLIARGDDGTALGMTTYHKQHCTWLDGGDTYLEDLFVDEATRGGGVGRALINAVSEAARAMGCERLYWTTNKGNTRARALYEKIAGPEDKDLVRYRISLT